MWFMKMLGFQGCGFGSMRQVIEFNMFAQLLICIWQKRQGRYSWFLFVFFLIIFN